MPYTTPQTNALKRFRKYKITKHHDDGDLSVRGLSRGNWESYVVSTNGMVYKREAIPKHIKTKRVSLSNLPKPKRITIPKQRSISGPYVPNKKPRQQIPLSGPYKRG